MYYRSRYRLLSHSSIKFSCTLCNDISGHTLRALKIVVVFANCRRSRQKSISALRDSNHCNYNDTISRRDPGDARM